MSIPEAAAHSCAVLFRVHFWDDYAERQYQRLRAQAGSARVFVLVDETNGPVAVPHDDVVGHTQDSVLALGLCGAGHGNLLWFNGDYPLYQFYAQHPGFDHYALVEYDVVMQRPLDEVLAFARSGGIDFLGLTKGEPVEQWPHTGSCLDAYSIDQVRKRLICFALFSNRAVAHLFGRRLELSRQYRDGAIQRWPYCEGFIPTALAAGGFKLGELSEIGPTDHYDWTPALVEADLPRMQGQAFLHPVLDEQRYLRSVMMHVARPESFFLPRSHLRRRLRRVPAGAYAPVLARALARRTAVLARRLAGLPRRVP